MLKQIPGILMDASTVVLNQIAYNITHLIPNFSCPSRKNRRSTLAKSSYVITYKELVKSITSDKGTEFAEHQEIAKKLNANFYFAHPYASLERGLSEYSNKLVRKYIPKQSEFCNFDDEYIKRLQYKINRRPRRNLMFKKPKDIFYEGVAFWGGINPGFIINKR